MKIIKILEFHLHYTIFENLWITQENHEKHENFRIQFQDNENFENGIISQDNKTIHENHRIQFENNENHENHTVPR